MNALLEQVINARNGMYCHVSEVSDVYELECIAESIYSENEDEHSKEVIIDFLESLTIYSLDDDNEEAVYNFSFTEFINSNQ